MINCDDIIGLEWGSKVRLSTGAHAYVLKPLILDFMFKGLRRVTQVIYPKDSSFMIALAGIRSGYRVLESGLGSGFLTIMLANAVGPDGRVYGYEVKREFAEVAERNLRRLGLRDRVVIKVKDIREGIDEVDLDAAFLDLPDPWEVLKILPNSLKPSSPVLIFLPTVNQVEKVLSELRNGPYVDHRVFEVLIREYQALPDALRPLSIGVLHTGYIVFTRLVKSD